MIKDSLIDSILNGKTLRESLAMFSESADSRIKTAHVVYDGDSWDFKGELTNGNFFIADPTGKVLFVDEMVSGDYDDTWYKKHLVMRLSGTHRNSFCNQLLVYFEKPENESQLNGLSKEELESFTVNFNQED